MKLFGDQKKQDENVNSKDMSAMSLSDDELADVSAGGSVNPGPGRAYDQYNPGGDATLDGYQQYNALGAKYQYMVKDEVIYQERLKREAEEAKERETLKLGFAQLWAWIKYRRGL